MTQNNDYKKELDEIALIYSEEKGFEQVLQKYKIRSIKNHIKGKRMLDIGCGVGFLCKAFCKNFERIVGIDGSLCKIKIAKEKNSDPIIEYIHTLDNEFNSKEKFDCIIVTNVLEHVLDDNAFLCRVYDMLNSDGQLIITVPNALGLHKRIGKQMNLIEDYYTLTDDDRAKGHKRIYDKNLLENAVMNAGFKCVHSEGILLKPLSHSQMVSWDIEVCDALYVIGKELPDYCSSILLIAIKK